jgi:hypothetical protein
MHTINLDKSPATYVPGEDVTGWITIDKAMVVPQYLRAILFWQTTGKGDKDSQLVESHDFIPGAITDGARVKFKLRVPNEGPYSFSGKYVALGWSVELATMHSKKDADAILTLPIIVSPTGKEIILPNLDPPNPFIKKLEER